MTNLLVQKYLSCYNKNINRPKKDISMEILKFLMCNKRANYLLMTLLLIITSCSGIRRYTTYYPYKENKEWSSQRVNYLILNLNYDTDIVQTINYVKIEKDTLFLQIIPGNDGLFFGPVLIPVFPVFLAPWGQDNWSKLKIELSSSIIEEYGIDNSNIHFIINNITEIYPIKLTQEQWKNVFYFDEKMKKIKDLSILIGSANRSIPPLFLKRKYKLDYRPFFVH